MSDAYTPPAGYQDKHWVAGQIVALLERSTDPAAADLLPRFNWLLRVWNTDRDFAYPSLKAYDPSDEGEEYIDVEDCVERGLHMTSVDESGYCNHCGEQDAGGEEDETGE